VSNTLLRLVPSVESLVADRLGYKFAVTAEKAFMTGNGASKPLGLFTASASGINTDRDISSGNSSTAPAFDGLINAKYSLKSGYLANARWLFHRDVLSVLAKIKDGNSQYIWQPSVVLGQPDRMLGLPMVMSEFAPNTLTANQYVGLLGDFKYYQIVDSLQMVMQRLVELYAETNQTGFIGRMEFDGAPILGEAFARVKLGA
jgi:HK97 family phage major capsid protein